MLDVTKERALAAERFVALVEQMSAEPEYETKVAVAERLGVHPSIVSQIMNGTRNSVGAKSVGNAIKKLGIDPEFFYGEFGEAPDYRAFMPGVDPVMERAARYPEVEEFLLTPFGASCTPEEVRRLREQAYKGVGRPTKDSLQFLVFSFRAEAQRSEDDPDDASGVLAAAEARALARGGKVTDIHAQSKGER